MQPLSFKQRGSFSLVALILVTGIALVVLAQFRAVIVPSRALGFRELERHRHQWFDHLAAEVLTQPPEERRGSLTLEDEDVSFRQWREADGPLETRLIALQASDQETWPRLSLLRLTSPQFDFYLLHFD
jgi:hypothetical protein